MRCPVFSITPAHERAGSSTQLAAHSQASVCHMSELEERLLEADGRVNGKAALSFTPVACAFGAALAALLFGYTLGYSSPSLPAMEGDVFHRLKCGDDDDSANVSSMLASLWSSIVNIGAMGGALCGFRILEDVGRRGALRIVAPWVAAGWIWTALASTSMELIAARLVVGAGVGLASSAVPVYISETAPTNLRGGLASVNQLAVTFGILLVYLVGYMLPHSRREYNCGQHVSSIHPSGWRTLAWVGACLAAALAVVATFFLPESPTWLARRGRYEDASSALQLLRGSCTDVTAELETLKATNGHQTAGAESTSTRRSTSVADLCRMLLPGPPSPACDLACREPLRISLSLMIIQQCSGINAVIFYASLILGTAGISNRDFGGLIVMLVQFIMTGVACLLVDRLGRRMLLLISLTTQIFASTLMALYYSIHAPPPVAILALVIFISGFSLGLGPLAWAMMPELLPTRARGIASAAATTVNWLCSFVITEIYAYLVIAIKPAGTFFLFALVGVAGFVYVLANVPETSGRSLDDIERFFASRAAAAGDLSSRMREMPVSDATIA